MSEVIITYARHCQLERAEQELEDLKRQIRHNAWTSEAFGIGSPGIMFVTRDGLRVFRRTALPIPPPRVIQLPVAPAMPDLSARSDTASNFQAIERRTYEFYGDTVINDNGTVYTVREYHER